MQATTMTVAAPTMLTEAAAVVVGVEPLLCSSSTSCPVVAVECGGAARN